jgi:hypothetical protein
MWPSHAWRVPHSIAAIHHLLFIGGGVAELIT